MNDAFTTLSPLLQTDAPAQLGPQARPGTLPLAELNTRLDTLLSDAGPAREREQLIRSLVLLWHDHLDESHSISQGIHSPDGSYLHGIMHRREPDFGNATYWFRKVGTHATFPQLAVETGELKGSSYFTGKLLKGGAWNPYAMIDACEAVEVGSADDGDADLLRAVQAIEFRLLLEHFAAQG